MVTFFTSLKNYFTPRRSQSVLGIPLVARQLLFGGWNLEACGIYYSGTYVETIWLKTFKHLKKKGVRPNRLLVLGQGAGSSFYAAKKVWGRNVPLVGVDIDPAILALGKEFYTPDFSRHAGLFSRLFQKGTVPISYRADALEFLKQNKEKFSAQGGPASGWDLIAVDLFDTDKPAPLVRSTELLMEVSRALLPGGIVVLNIFREDSQYKDIWNKQFTIMEQFQAGNNQFLVMRCE